MDADALVDMFGLLVYFLISCMFEPCRCRSTYFIRDYDTLYASGMQPLQHTYTHADIQTLTNES